ncbi:MAG: OmpA family protein [Thiolinea sp.]
MTFSDSELRQRSGTVQATAKKTPVSGAAGAELAQLRQLLLGKDYQSLLALKQQMDDPELYSARLADVISEALALRSARDRSIATALAPTLDNALAESIEQDPKRLANALYPVMGPAIRKSINEVLSQTFETFNQLLEQSLSPRSLFWRFDAWRTGRSYAEVVLVNTLEYHVEQVFLIHRETGLMLRHAQSPRAVSKDPDMVSGMLTAIQDFISDSFEVQEGEGLNTLRLGKLTVLIEQGPYAVIAAVVRGNVPSRLSGLLRDTQENIHRQMSNTLQHYAGDSEPFVRIHPLLERCLILQTQEKGKHRPWLAYAVTLLLLAGLLGWFYQQQQARQQAQLIEQQQQQAEAAAEQCWQQVLEQVQQEPGVMIVESGRKDGQAWMSGLLDPLAREPQQVVNALESSAAAGTAAELPSIRYHFKPYVSAEDVIVLRRAHLLLKPPSGVTLGLHQGVLSVSGQSHPDWMAHLQANWASTPGVQALDSSQLRVADDREQRLQRLTQQVQGSQYGFETGMATIDAQNPDLQRLVQAVRELLRLTREQQRLLQIRIIGNADQSGTQTGNRQLALERARNMRAYLSHRVFRK